MTFASVFRFLLATCTASAIFAGFSCQTDAQIIIVEDGSPAIKLSPSSPSRIMLPPGQAQPAAPVDDPFRPKAAPQDGNPVDGKAQQPPGGGAPPKKPDTPKEGKEKQEEAKQDENANTAKTIKRSTEPPTPANPKELTVRPDDNGMVSFQFHGQPWPEVMNWLADISQLALDWQELPADYLNLTTRRPYTVEEARDLINQRLVSRGYTILLFQETLSVVKIDKINLAQVPRIAPDSLDQRMPNEFVRCSFPLDWLVATDVVAEIESLKSPHGKLTAMPYANQIEVFDLVVNVREMGEYIRQQQSPDRRKMLAREFTLQHTRADTVAEELRQFLGIASGSSGGGGAVTPQQLAKMQQQMMQQLQRVQQQAANNKNTPRAQPRQIEIRVVANPRRNSIVVHASPDKLAVVEEFITLVDMPTASQGTLDALNTRVQVFRLVSLDPEKLHDSLMALGSLEPQTKLTIDAQNKALIVYGSLADQVIIKSVIDRLDGSGRRAHVVQLRKLPADQVAGSIMFLMGGNDDKTPQIQGWGWSRPRQDRTDRFRVTANIEYNQLLVWGNDIEMQEVANLLEKLGESSSGEGNAIRIVDPGDPTDVRDFLRRFKSIWPDNIELVLPPESDLPALPTPPTEPSNNVAPEKPAPTGGVPRLLPSTSAPESKLNKKNDIPNDELSESSQDNKLEAAAATRKWNASRLTSFLADAPLGNPIENDAEPSNAADGAAKNAMPAKAPLPQKRDESQPDVRQLRERLEALKRQRDNASRNQRQPAPQSRPKLRVTVNARGELVFVSDDPETLALVDQIAEQLRPRRKAYKIFQLKHADAFWVRFNLEDFFEEDEEDDNNRSYATGMSGGGALTGAQLGRRRPPRFIDDLDTNTILVRGADDEQLKIISELIDLYDVPEPKNEEKLRFTEVFRIQYSRPSLVEQTIKAALRDLLSSNDAALQQPKQNGNNNRGNGQQQQQQQQQQPPRSFPSKGKLSIGSDDVSRVMVVTCEGKTLMDLVRQLVEILDVAAQPADATEVVTIGRGINMQNLQQALGVFQKAQGQQQNQQQQQDQQQNGRPEGRAASRPIVPPGQPDAKSPPPPNAPPQPNANPFRGSQTNVQPSSIILGF